MKKEEMPTFKRIILTQGLKIGLDGLTAIARYLGYANERNFLNRVKLCSFDMLELEMMFDRLHFSDQDILDFFGRER